MDNKITFAQRSQPPIKAGKYSINVETSSSIPTHFKSLSKDIVVTSNRIQLKPDDIYSTYPPQNATGEYDECLPHIVLNRRTLPWEIDVIERDNTVPWMALLVFDETEGIKISETTVGELKKHSDGILAPTLTNIFQEPDNLSCNVIDVPVELVHHLLPYQEELILLSHVKGVSLDDKVTDSEVTDDFFSTVVTNRLNKIPIDKEESISHLACLVSLEGYGDLIDSQSSRQTLLTNYKFVRFIVLTSWVYYMAKKTFDFRSAFEKLDVDVMSSYIEKKGEDLVGDAKQRVDELTKLGFLPMNHQFRDGSKLVSWYQSPFIPYLEPLAKYDCVMFSDELLSYDPEIGMMDVTYASAWQLGRSLALADLAFATQLMDWRKSHQEFIFKAFHSRFIKQQILNVQLLSSSNAEDDVSHVVLYMNQHYPSKKKNRLQHEDNDQFIKSSFKGLVEELMKYQD